MVAIDGVMPEWDVREVHAVDLPCSPEDAIVAVVALPAAPDRILRLLFRIRGLRRSPTLGEAIGSRGFEVLARAPAEVVAGAAGRPWRRAGDLHAFEEAEPGSVRMAIDFRAEPTPTGCRLTTETRVRAVDPEALRLFRRYWRVIGPFSSLVRRRWLAAVRRSVDTA